MKTRGLFGGLFARAPRAPVAPAIPAGLRIYAIGDVHGRVDLLRPLLARVARAAAAPGAPRVRVVGLGDYVDRGPASREVLEILVLMKRVRVIEVAFLRGNHEDSLLAFLRDAGGGPSWCDFGGRETLASYGVEAPLERLDTEGWEKTRLAFEAALPSAHRELLRSLELSAEVGSYFFAHAGARPGVPLDAQDAHDLMWIRDDFLRSRRPLPRVVVHGHTPALEPHIDERRIGVDTGAYATGVLTALVLEGGERRWLQTGQDEAGRVELVEREALPAFR